MKKIGVLGIRGRVGSQLLKEGYVVGIDVDITNEEFVKKANLDNFDVIINCCAKTKVDKCVEDVYYDSAIKVNSEALEIIRTNFSGRLIHLSTDYVFKCNKGPYKELDDREPVNDYGLTKWGGEVVLETSYLGKETVVVRTTGLFGSDMDFGFALLSYLFELKEKGHGQPILVSKELHGNQTYIPHLCEALYYIAEMKLPEKFMYLHVGSSDVLSRYEFAIMLANAFGYNTDSIIPSKNSEIPGWVAKRPTKGGLQVKKAQKLGIPIYSTLEGILEYKEFRRYDS